ncbi:MAG: Smr/MutS family protein [bacterium]|nr:Smr/MutS family protein [bacterium]
MEANEINTRIFALEMRTDIPNVDLHGMRADEAKSSVETFLHQQFLADEDGVRIIFG